MWKNRCASTDAFSVGAMLLYSNYRFQYTPTLLIANKPFLSKHVCIYYGRFFKLIIQVTLECFEAYAFSFQESLAFRHGSNLAIQQDVPKTVQKKRTNQQTKTKPQPKQNLTTQ